MRSIEELEADEQRLAAEWLRAKTALRLAQEAACEFHVGDVVEAQRYGQGWRPAIVRHVEPWSFGASYRVSYRKKNGDWSAQVVYVGSGVRVVA